MRAGLVIVVLVPVLVLAQYQVRRFFGDEVPMCRVTAGSIRHDASQPVELGRAYDGDERPAAPDPGDLYVHHSGCVTAEIPCERRVEVFGRRVDCDEVAVA